MSSEAAEPSSPPPESPKPKPDATTSTPSPESPKPKPDATTSTPPPESAVKFTRAAALWTALIVGFVILILLLVFIAQNTDSAQFAFLGWRWSLPLGVAILLAAVCGGLVTVAAGTARIYQLRRAAKRNLNTR